MRISDWSSDVCSSDLSCETIRQAPAIDLPLPKVMASSALLAHLVVSRFVDHQPWHRQSVILRRQGVEIDRDVMGRWYRKLAWLMAPLGERLRSEERREGKECVSACSSRWSQYS